MRYALVLVGAVTTLIITLGLLGIPIGQLVLGGALTSVFVGIAAQQSLSNVFAGIVLMLAHPFRVGDGIRLQAGALGGQVSGTIVEVGITYVRIASSTGVLSIPNSQVLNCIIGPLPEPAGNDPQAPPPVMALPAVQPAPPAPPPMATRIVTHVRVPDSRAQRQRAQAPTATPRSRPAPRNPGRRARRRNRPAPPNRRQRTAVSAPCTLSALRASCCYLVPMASTGRRSAAACARAGAGGTRWKTRDRSG